MSKKLAEMFGALAEGLESAAAAARQIEGGYANATAKSGDSAADGVAGGAAGSKTTKAAASAPVAGKPAKPAKAKPAAITFETLKAKLTELVNSKGKEAAKEILSEFGAAKLVDLDEENYADAHAKAVEAMAAEEEDPTADDSDDMFGS